MPNLAPLFARAVGARERSGRPVLNVLLCENLHDADGVMRELIAAEWAIDAPPGRIGLIRTSIGRMVPVASPRARVTSVRVEPYGYLPVDAAAFVGHVELPARVIVDRDVSFDFYADRKLYIHNMGHFIAALLGRAAGLVRMDEVMDDWRSRYLVRAAMVEVAAALARRYNRPMAGLLAHIDDLLYRFGNRGLADTVDRVARDPARKMQPGDRMLGAVELCRQQHVPCPHVELGVWLGEAAVADRPVSQEDVIERVAETYRTLAAAGYV